MKKIMTILLLVLAQMIHAGAGDGTLPAIRAINIDFQQGHLQQRLNLPDCVNLGIKPSDMRAGGKEINAKFGLGNSKLVQEIKIHKNRGLIDLSVATRDAQNRILSSSLISVSEREFHNSVSFTQGEIQQRIQLNVTGKGCMQN